MTPTNEYNVRFAVPEDKDAVFEICLSVHGENGLFKFSVNKFERLWENYIGRNGPVIGVIGPTNNLQGAIILNLGTLYYTDEPMLEELFVHVLPEFRRSRNAIKLIEFAKTAANKIGVPLMIGIVSNHKTEAKIRLYQRRLGKPAGAFFFYNGDK